MSENQRLDSQQQPVATRTRRFSNTSIDQSNALESQVKTKRRPTSGEKVSDQLIRDVMLDKLVCILKKDATSRDEEEMKLLTEWSFLRPTADARIRHEITKSVLRQRETEQEESLESIEHKADILANLIEEANYIVIYTGAGISTSASIPDYRGPNGLWTQFKKTGKFLVNNTHNFASAEPTLTHMAIRELCERKIVNHVVSQNCDGLHLRSGIPQSHLSEIHGNMYIEVCQNCEKQYYRQADTTDKTARFKHQTGRKCHTCPEPNNKLIDTIVLYGERSRTQWPMNWTKAGKAAKRADLIICMGSSLKTLRRYNDLWPKTITRANNKEPETKLVIINLQYTPKDQHAVLKINGKCDLVMQLVMQRLNINVPAYDWFNDALHHLAIPFTPNEQANLKRNLIFDTRPAKLSSPSSSSLKVNAREESKSSGLFVAELTDDPDRKRLKMRFRAVTSSNLTNNRDESTLTHEELDISDTCVVDDDEPEVATQSVEHIAKPLDYVLPGWIAKSIGRTRTKSYKRKRHGNKGKKHSSVLKPHNESRNTREPDEVSKLDDIPTVKTEVLSPEAANYEP